MAVFRHALSRSLRGAVAGVCTASALVLAMATPASAAASSFTTSVRFPISVVVYVPCANGGAGEAVFLNGTLHDLFHIGSSGSGGFEVTAHDNPQGVGGVGAVTGTRYRGTGVTQSHFHVGGSSLPVTSTYVNNFSIVGQGPGNNFRVHETFHITINANGTITATVSNFRVTCK
jgi:hypothetical protein